MQTVTLGRTGLEVSRLALGTVELGMAYGIAMPGESGPPGEAESAALIQAAVDAGITLFDSAPAYGLAEARLGRALSGHPGCVIATKVADDASGVNGSLERSISALGRQTLDIVQVHNATAHSLNEGGVIEALASTDRVRAVGATVYGERDALAGVRHSAVDLVQIAFSILDQRPAVRTLPAARGTQTGVIARSVYLKGVLTPRARHLPQRMAPLRDAADRVRAAFGLDWDQLPQLAVRFALSTPGIDVVLVGLRTEAELDALLEAEALGPLADAERAALETMGLEDPQLLDPSTWPI